MTEFVAAFTITVNYDCSIPYWTTSVLSSTVTALVLILVIDHFLYCDCLERRLSYK
jgi:hypothetical protein